MKTLIIGNVYVDVIINVDSLPKTNDDILCKKQVISMGGCAYNVATILNNFGVEHDLISPVGKGIYASLIERELIENNYKIHIKEEEEDNGYCLCLVEEDGERTFITIKGIEYKYKMDWLDKIDSCDYENIYISGYEMEGHNGRIISRWLENQKNKKLFFGPGPRINFIEKDTLNKIFKLNPILHLNEEEAIKFTNEKDILNAARYLNNITDNTVFITLGENGVLYFNKDSYKFIDAVKTKVVNTIGAGDSHIGAIISSHSLGYEFEECCYIANKVSSKVVNSDKSRLEKDMFNKNEYILDNKVIV
ncbi:PfkB family carbohydrate kinase [[Clostridium] dakarense]|uniref:PfkB family carbohydrate kinase n=1 Tax=Faecalimicrobium dakarense TaxID=1301100 RepID=UPI0004AFB75B|nr:PfkB family carbohydrate kinase [[Clostridium] dakarense]